MSLAFDVDAERARAYVLAHGGVREQARAEGIFGRSGPDREVVRALEALQNPDGGFPLFQRPGNPSSVDTTCFILAQLKDLPPLAGSPMASRAVAFLRRVQDPAGFWVEGAPLAGMTPPWSTPTYLTANATYSLITLDPGHLDPVVRASGWLKRAIGEEAVQALPAQTLALSAALWYRLLGPAASEVAWGYSVLASRELNAAELAWLLSTAFEVGVGGRFLLPVARLLERLALLQRPDGAWPGEDGFELETTLQALRVFRGYGVI